MNGITILSLLAVALCFCVAACGQESTAGPTPTTTQITTQDPESPTATADTQPPPTPTPLVDTQPNPTPKPTVLGDLVCTPLVSTFDGKQKKQFVDWTPDGRHLIFDDGTTIKIVDAEGAHVRTLVDVNPDSTHPERPIYYGYYADVSPDGLRIVYSTCEYPTESAAWPQGGWGGREKYIYEIATIGLSGESPVRLTENEHVDNYPVWSPDGTRIASVGKVHESGPGGQLFIMYVGGANEPRAVGPPSGRVALYPPVWSPDGRLLAFIVNEGDRYSSRDILYTVRVDGSELTRILETTALPTWSQNGEELAFATISTDGEEAVIYMIRPDGTSLRRMWSSGPGASLEPVTHLSWSPDGSELLFVSDGVYVVRSDGSGLRRLAFGNRNTQAVWSPDGSRIAIYYRDELYSSGSLGTMARDGTYPRILATTDADGRFRAWNPPRPETYVDLAACSAGFVVPKPWENSGLVKDCETLLSLRDTLAGRAELPWSTNTFITEWRGVVVAGDPLRVREVVLADMGLTGTIPPEIGDLTELRRLDLSNNWLTSEIPGELGRLVKLEVLDLGFTWLSGHIPPELGRLSCLAALSLKGVRFAGCAPTELPEIWVEQSGLERCEPP